MLPLVLPLAFPVVVRPEAEKEECRRMGKGERGFFQILPPPPPPPPPPRWWLLRETSKHSKHSSSSGGEGRRDDIAAFAVATRERANNSNGSSGSSNEGERGRGARGLIQEDKQLAGAKQIGVKNWYDKQMRKKRRGTRILGYFRIDFFSFFFFLLFNFF